MIENLITNKYYEQLLPEALNEFKLKYKIKLENIYEKFLLDKNGGFINSNYVLYLGLNKEDYIHTVEFFNFERLEEILNIDLEDKEYEDRTGYFILKSKMLRIGQTNLGFDLCLSYSKKNFGKIYYIDDPHENEFIFLADNFEDFISRFEECPEMMI